MVACVADTFIALWVKRFIVTGVMASMLLQNGFKSVVRELVITIMVPKMLR